MCGVCRVCVYVGCVCMCVYVCVWGVCVWGVCTCESVGVSTAVCTAECHVIHELLHTSQTAASGVGRWSVTSIHMENWDSHMHITMVW